MSTFARRKRVLSFGILILVSLSGLSCRDGSRLTSAVITGPGPTKSSATLMNVDEEWDHYAADAVITITGGGPTKTSSPPPRRISYHTERLLGADGWTTTVSYDRTALSQEVRSNPIAKMLVSSDGTVQYFDTEGHAIVKPTPTSPASLPKTEPPVRPRQSVSPSDLRRWIDNVIINSANRDRNRSRLERALGAPSGQDGGLLRFRSKRSNAEVEVVFDSDRGVINEEALFRDGRLISRTIYTYTEESPGTFVTSLTRTERTGDDNARPLIVERALSNVQLDRRGGT